MIVVDTSALMAILLNEPSAPACMAALSTSEIIISAGTLAELLIVAGQRGLTGRAEQLVKELEMEVIGVDERLARNMGAAYIRWGRGNHPAALNYGDCFAYALAKQRDWLLLFVGDDFSHTDIRPVVPH